MDNPGLRTGPVHIDDVRPSKSGLQEYVELLESQSNNGYSYYFRTVSTPSDELIHKLSRELPQPFRFDASSDVAVTPTSTGYRVTYFWNDPQRDAHLNKAWSVDDRLLCTIYGARLRLVRIYTPLPTSIETLDQHQHALGRLFDFKGLKLLNLRHDRVARKFLGNFWLADVPNNTSVLAFHAVRKIDVLYDQGAQTSTITTTALNFCPACLRYKRECCCAKPQANAAAAQQDRRGRSASRLSSTSSRNQSPAPQPFFASSGSSWQAARGKGRQAPISVESTSLSSNRFESLSSAEPSANDSKGEETSSSSSSSSSSSTKAQKKANKKHKRGRKQRENAAASTFSTDAPRPSTSDFTRNQVSAPILTFVAKQPAGSAAQGSKASSFPSSSSASSAPSFSVAAPAQVPVAAQSGSYVSASPQQATPGVQPPPTQPDPMAVVDADGVDAGLVDKGGGISTLQ